MSKNVIVENRKPLYVLILQAQDRDLRDACARIGLTKTDAVGEALQYWLAAQRKMGVFEDGK